MTDRQANDKLQAAYALNLCTVSVSQIVDYDDINILEQEYEAILNNLNLEHMPHDEALLSILKQLLDTITFFRIQEGDKKMIELKYREKMKNAIWNAVPNFGLIVAGGNPWTIAVSLASQIGIGYMNYRKQKSTNDLDYTEEKWRLQRAAMEQFNGLRRELFDTAWRLADAYGFEDKYRLTERQIKHYDNILMDENALRKHDRLESIQDSFAAYPPFWYYIGNVANEICRDSSLNISEETRHYYREKAKEYFQKYWDANKYPLLREDLLASSCALEYSDLLIEDGADQNYVIELIDKAVQYAGNAWDVLQLCAIGYLKVDAKDKAIPALKVLVNEKYNTSVNAQILSSIYVSDYLNNGKEIARSQYEALDQRTGNKAYLMPWPTGDNNPNQEFIENQRDMLTRRYRKAINSFRDKYTYLLNSIITIPDSDMDYAEADYSEACKDQRMRAVEHALASQDRQIFLDELNDIAFGIEYVNLINKMLLSLSSLSVITDIDSVAKKVGQLITEKSATIEAIQKKMREFDFSDEDYETLQRITSKEFLEEPFEDIAGQIEISIKSMEDMGSFSGASSEMAEFCAEEGIPLPDSKEDRIENSIANIGRQVFITNDVLGDKEEYFSKLLANKEVMSAIIRKKMEEALVGSPNLTIVYPGTKAFNDYFAKSKRIIKKYKNEVLAILDDKAFIFDTDLLFGTNGVFIVERGELKAMCSYNDINYEPNTSKLMLGSIQYRNNNIDIAKMNEAFVELRQASQKR